MDHKEHVRAVAIFEAIKGIGFVLIVGLIMLALANDGLMEDLDDWAGHMDAEHSKPFITHVLEAMQNPSRSTLVVFITIAILYPSFRFIEAYGLWRQYAWAKWFGLLTGAVYLPFEIYKLILKPSWGLVLILAINVLVVWVLYRSLKGQAFVHKEVRMMADAESAGETTAGGDETV